MENAGLTFHIADQGILHNQSTFGRVRRSLRNNLTKFVYNKRSPRNYWNVYINPAFHPNILHTKSILHVTIMEAIRNIINQVMQCFFGENTEDQSRSTGIMDLTGGEMNTGSIRSHPSWTHSKMKGVQRTIF